MILVGIDTGANTGLALYDTDSRSLIDVSTVRIHQAMEVVRALAEGQKEVAVRFEDARQRKWIPNTGDYGREKGRAQGAGYVKAHCQIWEDFLSELQVPYEAVAPRNNATKLGAEAFAAITGWKGRTSEHGRDAAMLVFGMKRINNRNAYEGQKGHR